MEVYEFKTLDEALQFAIRSLFKNRQEPKPEPEPEPEDTRPHQTGPGAPVAPMSQGEPVALSHQIDDLRSDNHKLHAEVKRLGDENARLKNALNPSPVYVKDLERQLADVRAKNTQLEVANRALRTAQDQQRRIGSFQDRAINWCLSCFGHTAVTHKRERALRFGEEAIELMIAAGLTLSDIHNLVTDGWAKNLKDPHTFNNEVGGTLVTLALLCEAQGGSMNDLGEAELDRVWRRIPEIRAKHETKAASVRAWGMGGK